MGLFDFLKGKKDKAPEPEEPVNQPQAQVDVQPQNKAGISFRTDSISPDVIPIEKRMRGKEPTCDGLYPHEVLVLSYAHKYFDTDTDFQNFWWYQYGIKDMQGVLQSLTVRGYITRGSIMDAVLAEKLPAIKDALKKHELKVSGKKNELAQRLADSVSEDELSQLFPKRPYAVTEQGAEILKKYEWIPYIHAHRIEDLDIWNLTEMVQTPPYMKYRDKIWGYLNQKSMDYAAASKFGLYRNTRFEMSEFDAEEGKLDWAFHLLCEVIAYDLSGVGNNFDPEFFYMEAAHFFPYEHSIVIMAPGVTNRLFRYGLLLEYDDPDIREKLIEEIGKLSLPYRLFTPEECADIVFAERDKDKEALSRIYENAEKKFNATELGKKAQKAKNGEWVW